MEREFVWVDGAFLPDAEFNSFLKSIGYVNLDLLSFDCLFDERVVEYVKAHTNLWGNRMKGAKSSFYKIGFAGAASVLKVDTDRKWTIKYRNDDSPYVAYVEESVNKYGHYAVSFIKA